ncbi:MAG: ABC transporter substrate-binding protein [Chloroflexota bacterium]
MKDRRAEESESTAGLSRRRFVAGAAQGAASLALAGEVGRRLLDAGPARAAATGGTLVATTQADIGDFDPAVSYAWANYNLLHCVFNGLLGYKPGTLALTPDLAAGMPKTSADGLVWTFTLRRGVRFHSPVNREVQASDFKYSWERVLNPKTASPGVTFLLHIEGAAEYNAGKAKDVSGIKVLGPYTLQVRLVKPYVPFRYVCAMTFAYVVPHEIADKYPKDFSHHAVGTGPFMVQEWTPGQKFVLARNPHYYQPGIPYLDQVVFNIGVQPNVAILQVERGEADVATDGLTGLNYTTVSSNPRWKDRVFKVPSVSTAYMWMDTLVLPFTNRKVRQAIAMSIDKQRIIQVNAGGLGKPTGGILPPLMPGYDAKLHTWPYDPARAKQLLAQAGYPHGFKTTILANGSSVSQAVVEQVIQHDLAQIGVAAEIKVAIGSTYTTLISQPKAVAIGDTSWTLDFPDPSDFIDPILTSTAAVQGGSNFAFYRNPTVDSLAAQANQTLDPTARYALYHHLEQIIINDAPWVPLYTPEQATLVSPRVTTFYMSPLWYEFDFAYYKVSG